MVNDNNTYLMSIEDLGFENEMDVLDNCMIVESNGIFLVSL